MLPMKLNLSEELAATLRQLRLDHPVNGEVLTAENLSKAIGNNRAWMSQIESRRLKKIRREDIIKIYKVLYCESDESEAEDRAELALGKFYTKPDPTIQLNPSIVREEATIYGTGTTNEDYNKESFSFLLNSLDTTLTTTFLEIKDAGRQGDFLHMLLLFMGNITSAYEDTRLFIEKLPLDLLQYATVEERKNILDQLDCISKMLSSLEIRDTEIQFIKRMEEHNNNKISASDIQSLFFGLSELSKMVEKDELISGSIIEYINKFIIIVQKYYLNQNIPVPILIEKLSDTSQKADWLNIIHKLQILLSDSKDSHYFIKDRKIDNKDTP